MLAEKFLLLLETLLGRVVDDKSLAVTSTRAAFPDPPPLLRQQRGEDRGVKADRFGHLDGLSS